MVRYPPPKRPRALNAGVALPQPDLKGLQHERMPVRRKGGFVVLLGSHFQQSADQPDRSEHNPAAQTR